jgi:TonB family protein
MLGLTKKESKFFMNSLVGHAVLIALAGAFGFLPSCEEQDEKVHVFELASASYAPTPPPMPVEVIKPVPPKVVPSPPQQTPKPIVKAKPEPKKVTPNPTRVPKSKPKPPIKPKPKPPSKPKTVTIDQFRKEHNLAAVSKPSHKPVPQKPKVRINPDNFSLPKITISNPSTQVSNVDPTILNRYLGEVKAKLEAAWRRLQAGTDVGVGGEAFLSFRISSNGTLLSPLISRSSGNKTLDGLVLQVSKSVGNLGRPPGGKLSSSLEIPFRIK